MSMYQTAGDGSITVVNKQTGQSNVLPQIDTLEINGNDGSFRLGFNGNTTAALPYNISSLDLQNAIGNLPGIGLTNVTVTGNAAGPYTVTFASQLGNVVLTADATLLKRNEVQVLTVKQTSGNYTLTDTLGHSTGTINFDASAADRPRSSRPRWTEPRPEVQRRQNLEARPGGIEPVALAGIVGTEEVYTITFLGHIFEHLLVANVSTLVDAGTFTLVQTNPNLLVDPAAQVQASLRSMMTTTRRTSAASSTSSTTACRPTRISTQIWSMRVSPGSAWAATSRSARICSLAASPSPTCRR